MVMCGSCQFEIFKKHEKISKYQKPRINALIFVQNQKGQPGAAALQ
jgi:hypothetical protein